MENKPLTKSAKIESGRAEFAFTEVAKVAKTPRKGEYKSYCKKFPNMIQINGLAAAVAFAFEKRKSSKGERKAWFDVYDNTAEWLRQAEMLTSEGENALIEYVCGLETAEYRLATKEVLALFEWIRRFASGLIGEE